MTNQELVNLHKRIYALSARSHKSLSARTLKLGEEFGELSEAVSVVSGEDQYKGKTVEDIRLEVADVICCAMSIAQKAGITLEGIDDALSEKSDKWERIINDLEAGE